MAELSPDERCTVDEFIKARLKSCHVTDKGMITGYLDSKPAYDELLRDLKVFGCRYSVRSCYTGKTDSGSLQYQISSPDFHIPFTGSPFHVQGTTYYVCTHGIRYFKSKVSTENDSNDDLENNVPKRKLRKINESIKQGCPAKMTVKCIRVYPDYKTPSDSWRRKAEVLKRLKEAMKLPDPPHFELNFWISVSSENSHTHERTLTQRIQPLHPELIAEIHNFVRRGVTSTPVIKAHLKTYVENMFKKSSIRPDSLNTAFYPCDKSVYNHVYEAKISIAKENIKTGSHADAPMTATLPSTDTSAPRQDTPISEKSDSELSAVRVLDTFTTDWQDEAVLPPNFVQVVNNNGTFMLMVTQPIGDQVIGRLENPVIDSQSNLVNVNLDENIYTVITDTSEQRILSINGNTNILMTQPSSNNENIEEVLDVQDNSQPTVLNSEKNSEINLGHVISMEGSVIMNVQSSSTICEDRDVDDSSCTEDPNQYLFVEDDSQPELLGDPKSGIKVYSNLCSLPPPDASKDIQTGLFPSTFENDDDLDKNMNEDCALNAGIGIVKKMKNVKKRGLGSAGPVDCQDEVTLSVSHKALRDSALDIINMSYSLPNSDLLEEMVRVFEKYRNRVHDELEYREQAADDHMPSLSLAQKSNLKTPHKISEYFENERESSQSLNCVENSRLRRNRGTVFSSSDSSIDDYDDLVITD